MANEVQTIQGDDLKLYARLLDDAKTKRAELVQYQTSLKMSFKRDSDSEQTKDGNIATDASLETEFELEFINNSSVMADAFYSNIVLNKKMELWAVNINRTNKDGKYEAWYLRGKVSSDETEAKTGDASERSVEFSVDGTPQRGWLALDKDQEAEVNYLFRGLDIVKDGADGAPETNGGTPWTDADNGTYVPVTGGGTPEQEQKKEQKKTK